MIEHLPDTPTRQDEESHIVANWLRRVQDLLREDHPLLFTRAIERSGLSITDLQSDRHLTHHHLDAVISFARREVPDLTLQLLKTAELLDLGMMGYAVLSCDTLGNALKVLLRYQDLTSDRFVETAEVEDGFFCISAVPLSRYLDDSQNIAEDCIGGNWRAIVLLLGPDADLKGASVDFAFASPEYQHTYQSVFQPCQINFDAEQSRLRIPEDWLERPVTSANSVMSGVAAAVCERILGPGRYTRMDTPRAVRALLLSRSGRRMLRLEEAAEELVMSTAQLRKRLYRAKTSYKSIVLETRMSLARHYLESTPLSIQEIAFLLDYAQPGPFSRAFKKYYGFPPGNARSIGLESSGAF